MTKLRKTCFYCRKKRYANLMLNVVHRLQKKPFLNAPVALYHYAVCISCLPKITQTKFINEIVLPERTINT